MKKWFSIFLIYATVLFGCRNEAHQEVHRDTHREASETPMRISNRTTNQLADTAAINKALTRSDSLMRANTDSAKLLLARILYQSYKINYEKGIIRSYSRFGKLYFDAGKFDTALVFFRKALQHAREQPGELGLNSMVHNVIGATYHRLDKTDSSAVHLYEAARLLSQKSFQTQVKDKDDLVYLNIALFWLHREDPEKADPFLKKALYIAALRKDSSQMLKVYNAVAQKYQIEKKYDSATNIYRTILNSPLTDTADRINANLNIGNIYLSHDLPAKAVPFYTLAQQLSVAQHSDDGKLKSAHKLAQAYFKLEDYEAAAPIFLETVRLATHSKRPEELEVAYQYLADLSDKRGLYERASTYRAQLINLWKERYPKESAEMMSRLDVQYRVAEQEKQLLQKELLLQQQQNQLREKNYWIGSVAIGSLLLIALSGNMYRSNRRRKRLHEKQLQLLQQQQQIEQLQAVMKGEEQERTRLARELHDGVGGMLAAIKMNISVHDRQKNSEWQTVVQMVEATAAEVRKTAHNLMPETLQRHHLQEALRIYCDGINTAQNLQIDTQFHSGWTQQSNSFELSVYRVLQELIQNIIKHAEAKHVVLQFRNDDEALHITVEDDGKGFETDTVQEGLGLRNIRARVTSLGGTLSLESSPGRGTTCYMELPLDRK